jgi:hypothetical protein
MDQILAIRRVAHGIVHEADLVAFRAAGGRSSAQAGEDLQAPPLN